MPRPLGFALTAALLLVAIATPASAQTAHTAAAAPGASSASHILSVGTGAAWGVESSGPTTGGVALGLDAEVRYGYRLNPYLTLEGFGGAVGSESTIFLASRASTLRYHTGVAARLGLPWDVTPTLSFGLGYGINDTDWHATDFELFRPEDEPIPSMSGTQLSHSAHTTTQLGLRALGEVFVFDLNLEIQNTLWADVLGTRVTSRTEAPLTPAPDFNATADAFDVRSMGLRASFGARF